MVGSTVQRRLAAVLAADVVGFSRLVGQDELAALGALKALHVELIDPKIAEYQGRVFKRTGDGVLAEFPSVVNAVACAVDIQEQAEARNFSVPEHLAVRLRIAVHVGDIVVEGDDLLGDGVNVAVRLEGIAPPGGVAISAFVRDQIGNRLDLHFEDMGEQTLKNIERPIHAYQTGRKSPEKTILSTQLERPSVAVLPFDNMSDEPGQRYFSDGISEDIITELSRFRQLHVIARNSSFRYRGGNTDMIRVSRELGVQYLVEGSVRRLGNQIRITAQLIDAVSGNHVWAERFDRNEEEIFSVQDHLVRTIAGTLAGRLKAVSVDRALRKPPSSLAAYECVLRADSLPFDNEAALAEAQQLFEKAIELDPGYGRAYALLSNLYSVRWIDHPTNNNNNNRELLDKALDLARKSVALDETDSVCQQALGWIHSTRRSYDLAEHHLRKALDLTPNQPNVWTSLGSFYTGLGKPEEAISYIKEAKIVDPHFEPRWYWPTLGCAYFCNHQYEEAIANLRRSPNMPYWVEAFMAASYALLGQADDAKENASAVLSQAPEFSSNRFVTKECFKNVNDEQHLLGGLLKSGLPE